jgi:hypothetical protein
MIVAGISRFFAYVYPAAEDFDFGGDERVPFLLGGGPPEGLPPLGEVHDVAPLVLPLADPAIDVAPAPDAPAPDMGEPVVPADAPPVPVEAAAASPRISPSIIRLSSKALTL